VPTGDDYDRGVAAGEIAARLAGHDRHFASINGSLEKIATEMHALTLAVQRLGDQAEANAKTVISTAKALKEADETRRQSYEQGFSPIQKVIAVVGAVGVLVVIVVTLVQLV
jgi:hypothetical protein